MVNVGDEIKINGDKQATVTALYQQGDNRWVIGYKNGDGTGFFIEGDEDFKKVKYGQ